MVEFEENKVTTLIGFNGKLEGLFDIEKKLTVKEQIEINLKDYQKDKTNRIINSLKMVNLDKDYLNKEMSKLSSGEYQKVLIASILAHNSKIIGLEDIYLDTKAKNNLIKIIRLLKNRYHRTIIIKTNDVDFAHKISDYVYIYDGDKVVLSGNKYDVFTNFTLLKKYGIDIPSVIKFSKMVLDKKNKKIGFRDEINDLLKDIYRYK